MNSEMIIFVVHLLNIILGTSCVGLQVYIVKTASREEAVDHFPMYIFWFYAVEAYIAFICRTYLQNNAWFLIWRIASGLLLMSTGVLLVVSSTTGILTVHSFRSVFYDGDVMNKVRFLNGILAILNGILFPLVQFPTCCSINVPFGEGIGLTRADILRCIRANNNSPISDALIFDNSSSEEENADENAGQPTGDPPQSRTPSPPQAIVYPRNYHPHRIPSSNVRQYI